MTAPVPLRIVPAVADPRHEEIASFGAVHLEVTDLGRSTAFWTEVVGLVARAEQADEVQLGTESEVLVVLHAGARAGFQQRHSGLYHLAVHPQTDVEFARVLLRIIRARWAVSPTDHIMSKALYLLDPDGITVEITLETPERLREIVVGDAEPSAIGTDGERYSVREPLDVTAVLAALQDDDTDRPLPVGTTIGHVHLYVGDLAAAYGFYRSFGFNEAVYAPRIHMGDLGAGGAFNHRLAMNTWQGQGAPQSPVGTARMRNFTIRLDTHERLDHVLGAVAADPLTVEGGYLLRDPSLNALVLTA